MKQKKSGGLTTVLLMLAFLTGLSLVLYPSVSNRWNAMHQTRIITSYDSGLADIDREQYARLWDDARAYNASLAAGDAEPEVYESLLDPYGNGYMGYVEIPSIGAKLPIAHGVETAALDRAVGHLEWSSLPVGGESTHCVLSGHRGLPSAELLTNLDQMELGDRFTLHVLGETLEYRVDAVNVVEPDDASLLQITEGEDYVTLLTCTPYGVNSHRLLVRGTRVQRDAPSALPQVANEVRPVSLALQLAVCMAVLLASYVLLRRMVVRKGSRGEGRLMCSRE